MTEKWEDWSDNDYQKALDRCWELMGIETLSDEELKELESLSESLDNYETKRFGPL